MITTKITLSCNMKGCTDKHIIEGLGVTRLQLYAESKKAGWQWKSNSVQFCPKHKTVKVAKVKVAKKAKLSKPAPKPKAKTASVAGALKAKSATKATKPSAAKPAAAPAPLWNPAPKNTGE